MSTAPDGGQSPEEDIVLVLDKVPRCPGCANDALLLARYRHAWHNHRGEEVTGVREVLLCAQCSRGNRPADELIALFTVDGQLSGENLETFAALAEQWVEAAKDGADPAAVEEQYEAWHKGEL